MTTPHPRTAPDQTADSRGREHDLHSAGVVLPDVIVYFPLFRHVSASLRESSDDQSVLSNSELRQGPYLHAHAQRIHLARQPLSITPHSRSIGQRLLRPRPGSW